MDRPSVWHRPLVAAFVGTLLAAAPTFAATEALSPVPELPSSSNGAAGSDGAASKTVPFKFSKPSDEMDFAIKPVPEASFSVPANDAPSAPPASPGGDTTVGNTSGIPAPPPLQPLPSGGTTTTTTVPATDAYGKPLDQFFSTTPVLPEEITTTTRTTPSTEAGPGKKSPRRKTSRPSGPRWGRAGAPFPGFHSVRLPEPIYSKHYDRANLGLPVAVHQSDLQRLLALATVRSRIEDMRALVRSGAEIDEPTSSGESLVSLATRHHRPDAVRWLLQHGADPNSPDGTGASPLAYAARGNDHVTTNLLLRYGADQNTIDIRGTSALAAAESRNAENAAIVLRRSGG